MVKEISNKTLTFLVVMAIVVSLGGTLASLSRLALLEAPLTGFASTGIVNLSVTRRTSISVTRNIDFGNGYINESDTTYVVLQSNHSEYKADKSNGSWSWTASGLQYFLIENDGNRNLTLNVSANTTAANFIGGGVGTLSDPVLEYGVNFETGDACVFNQSVGRGNAQNTWLTLSNTNTTACEFFYYNASSDKINVSVRIGIPQDAATGRRDALVDFHAIEIT